MFTRFLQVLEYGWNDAHEIASSTSNSRVAIYLDIIKSYFKYSLWSNQYKKHKFWELDETQRDEIGNKLGAVNREHDKWINEWHQERKFIQKYSSIKYDTSSNRRRKRSEAYQKRFNMGKGTDVQYDVDICKAHYMNGSIKIGKKCFLGKHTFIDYTGKVVIEDNVLIANGTIIETHHRDIQEYNKGRDINIPTELLIRERAYIGSRVMILDSCNYIGKCARIGAGTVVTKDVPDYAVVVGVPGKIIKMLDPQS